jgi:hypothetical protein
MSRARRAFDATIQVKSNLRLTMRERGKIVDRRVGHNIFLDLGREWLTQLVGYSSFEPLTTYRDDRIRYMGVGIGSTRQVAATVANTSPLLTAYPGTNAQTDTDATLARLERPVRISGSSTVYPSYLATDVWIGQVQAPPTFPSASEVQFRRLFTQLEVSYTPYLSVPLSEVALYTSAANVNVYNNTGVAYDTFDTLSKTDAFELEIAWTLQF